MPKVEVTATAPDTPGDILANVMSLAHEYRVPMQVMAHLVFNAERFGVPMVHLEGVLQAALAADLRLVHDAT
jgi:hypothetical protein